MPDKKTGWVPISFGDDVWRGSDNKVVPPEVLAGDLPQDQGRHKASKLDAEEPVIPETQTDHAIEIGVFPFGHVRVIHHDGKISDLSNGEYGFTQSWARTLQYDCLREPHATAETKVWKLNGRYYKEEPRESSDY